MSNMRRKLLQEYGSVNNYLINKLDVDEKLLEKTITKYPSILRIKFKKLTELIDMLRQNNITGDDIVSHPKIFYFNIETLRQRIETLKEAGIPLKVSLIIRSQRMSNRHKCKSYDSTNIST